MTIFINYRHDDSKAITGRIYDHLRDKFKKKNVYRDEDSIPTGIDFEKDIQTALEQCSVFLAIIGKQWLTERLHDKTDFVLFEIETALNRKIPVIPVLVDGGTLPEKDELPLSLQPLVKRQGISVDSSNMFDAQMRKLIKEIRQARGFWWKKPVFIVTIIVAIIITTVFALFILVQYNPIQNSITLPDRPTVIVVPFSSSPSREADKQLWPLADRILFNNLAKADLLENRLTRIDPLRVSAEIAKRKINSQPSRNEALELASFFKADILVLGKIERINGLIISSAILLFKYDGNYGKETDFSVQNVDLFPTIDLISEKIEHYLLKNNPKNGEKILPLPAEDLDPALYRCILPDSDNSEIARNWIAISEDPWSEESYVNFLNSVAKTKDSDLLDFAKVIARKPEKDLPCKNSAGILSIKYSCSGGSLFKAVCAFRQLSFKEAVKHAEVSFNVAALRPFAAAFLGNVIGQVKDVKGRIDFYKKRVMLFPERAAPWSFLALLLANDNQQEAARSAIDVARSLDVNQDFKVALNGVRVFLRLEDILSANSWMGKLLEVTPRNEFDDMYRATLQATLFHVQGHFAEGWRVLESARKGLSSKPGEAYTIVAITLFYSYLYFGEIDKADNIAREYLSFFSSPNEPDHIVGHFLELAVKAKRSTVSDKLLVQKASELGDELSRLMPESSRSSIDGHLCLLFSHVGRPKNASDILSHAESSNTMIAGCRFQSAVLQMSKREKKYYANAKDLFERARSDILYRNNWYVEFYLAALLGEAQSAEQIGDTVSAKRLFENIVSLCADAPPFFELTEARNALMRYSGTVN